MPNRRRKIRIFYLIPSLQTGGAERQLLTLVRGLDSSRFEVTVAIFYDGGHERELEGISNVRLIRLGKKHGLHFQPIFLLMRELYRRPQDILHAFNLSARFIGLLCGRVARVPIVVLAERTDRPIATSLGSRLYLLLEGIAFRLADYVIANSSAGRRFVLRRNVRAERVTVIANGVDRLRLLPKRTAEEMRSFLQLPQESFVIGMLGRLEPIKEPDRFFQVLHAVTQKDDTIRGLIVGDGSLAESLQRKARRLQLADKLIFVGRQDDPADFLQVMDILVHPSLGAEGCPNAVLEAMAMGKPVIAGRTSGAAAVINTEENGILIAHDDIDEWSAAVLRLRRDADLRRRLGEAARRRIAQDFSVEALIAAHSRLYEEWYHKAKNRLAV